MDEASHSFIHCSIVCHHSLTIWPFKAYIPPPIPQLPLLHVNPPRPLPLPPPPLRKIRHCPQPKKYLGLFVYFWRLTNAKRQRGLHGSCFFFLPRPFSQKFVKVFFQAKQMSPRVRDHFRILSAETLVSCSKSRRQLD